MHLKNLKKHFRKLKRYKCGIDYLFNEHSEEDYITNNDIKVFKEARSLFNKRRTNLFRKEINKIRKKLHKKKQIIIF